jgi:type IV pilus assembly protein PilQ
MWEKSMAAWRSRLFAILVLAGAALPAWSQGAIQAITSSQQAGAEVIRVELSEALATVPAGFTVQAPPRIAIDLPGVTSALGKPMIEINQGNLRSVSVAQSGERTRLVLNLKQPAGYRAQLDGKVLVVTLENIVPATWRRRPRRRRRVSPRAPTAPAAAEGHRLRRGADGAGRVVVELPNNQVGVDIRQQGASLVVEFLRSSLL